MHGPMTGLLDLFEGRGPEPARSNRTSTSSTAAGRSCGRCAGWPPTAPVVVADRRRAVARRGLGPGAALRPPAAGRRTGRRARHRSDDRRTSPADVVPPDRVEEVVVGPLLARPHPPSSAPSSARCPCPTLERIHELSGGNPMYAIELARSADARRPPRLGRRRRRCVACCRPPRRRARRPAGRPAHRGRPRTGAAGPRSTARRGAGRRAR